MQESLANEANTVRFFSDLFSFAKDRFFKENKNLTKTPSSMDDIRQFFKRLDEQVKKGEVWATIIANEIFHKITKKSVRKRRVSAYRFEMLLCDLFNFRRVEEVDPEFPDKEIERRARRNRLEKGDLRYKKVLSVKTLLPRNNEINLGSFSSEALFKGFIEPVPQERLELGSKPALRKKFKKIKDEGKWDEFCERVRKMVNFIYYCDWIIGIKGHDTLIIYTMIGSDFRELLLSYFKEDEKRPTQFINRFEAHALRVNVTPFFDKADKTTTLLQGPATKRMEDIKSKILGLSIPSSRFAANEIDEKEFDEIAHVTFEEIKKISKRK